MILIKNKIKISGMATAILGLLLLFSINSAFAATQTTIVEVLTISGNDKELGDGEFYAKFAGKAGKEVSVNNPNSYAVDDYTIEKSVTISIWYTIELWDNDGIGDDKIFILRVKLLRDFGSYKFTIDTLDLSTGYTYTIYIGSTAYISFYIEYRNTRTPNGNIAFNIFKK